MNRKKESSNSKSLLKPSYANIYADVAIRKPPELLSVEYIKLPVSNYNDYLLVRFLGRGCFSTVCKAYNRREDKFQVLKFIKKSNNHEFQVKKECLMLKNLEGSDRIIKFCSVVQNSSTGLYALVFESFQGVTMHAVSHTFSVADIRHYMYEIFSAVDYTHSCGIMHRDIKPENILINSIERKIKLIDWGLADFYIPYKIYEKSEGTLYYAAPEMLLGYLMHTYSADVWSLGCIFGSLLFKKIPLFYGTSTMDQIKKILEVLGHHSYVKFIEKYNMPYPKDMCLCETTKQKMTWFSLINDQNKEFFSPRALEVLKRMLVFDHGERISVKRALELPYFADNLHKPLYKSVAVSGHTTPTKQQTYSYK